MLGIRTDPERILRRPPKRNAPNAARRFSRGNVGVGALIREWQHQEPLDAFDGDLVRPIPPIMRKLQASVREWARNLLREWATVYDSVTDRVNGSLRWSETNPADDPPVGRRGSRRGRNRRGRN